MDPTTETTDDAVIQRAASERKPPFPLKDKSVVGALTSRLDEHAARMDGQDARAIRLDDAVSSLRVEAKQAEEAAHRAETLAREAAAKLATAGEQPAPSATPALAVYVGSACGVVSLVWLLLHAAGV